MDLVDQNLQAFQRAEQAKGDASRWLADFETALVSQDADRIAALFHEESHWRDILAFTWYYTPVTGSREIAGRLVAEQSRVNAKGFHLPDERCQPRHVKRVGIDSIEAIFEFTTAIGSGAGIIRLSPDAGGILKAWQISTTLQSITGHDEKIGANRPTGSAYSRNFGGDNWADVRRKAVAYQDREPTVLVIGGAQSGLSVAARLNQLGIDTLVVEKWPRIGDSWRKRYHSLALHNSIHLNHLPYMDYPSTWPVYIPKDMLGNWFEFYADALEINCWTDTEFVNADWDEASKTWTATVRRGDGTERVVRL